MNSMSSLVLKKHASGEQIDGGGDGIKCIEISLHHTHILLFLTHPCPCPTHIPIYHLVAHSNSIATVASPTSFFPI